MLEKRNNEIKNINKILKEKEEEENNKNKNLFGNIINEPQDIKEIENEEITKLKNQIKIIENINENIQKGSEKDKLENNITILKNLEEINRINDQINKKRLKILSKKENESNKVKIKEAQKIIFDDTYTKNIIIDDLKDSLDEYNNIIKKSNILEKKKIKKILLIKY